MHLDKGCYRGQETVARVHTLGRPPRRLTLLHLDGSREPAARASARDLLLGREGRSASSARSARHHELGPIALGAGQAQRRRSTPSSTVDGMPAAQEVVVDPEVGLHVRPLR